MEPNLAFLLDFYSEPPPMESIATQLSFLLLFLCFVREKQICDPGLQRKDKQILAEIASQRSSSGTSRGQSRDKHVVDTPKSSTYGHLLPSDRDETHAYVCSSPGLCEKGLGGLITTALSLAAYFLSFLSFFFCLKSASGDDFTNS